MAEPPRSASDAEYTPRPGNVYRVVIANLSGTIALNPCSYVIAQAFAERWNKLHHTRAARVVFIEEDSPSSDGDNKE